MRLWHLLVAVAAVSVVMSLAREPMARVFVIVFVTGLGEIAFATAALLALFRTIGALGEAKELSAGVAAVAATSVVLALSTVAMTAWLVAGVWLVSVTV